MHLADHLQDSLNSYKKKAIELAIGQSKGSWIITTDADCFVQPNWLSLFDAYIQTNAPVFIAAPVQFRNNGSFLSIFQALDFISLQGITAASVAAGTHAMCNGANLAYEKKAFYAVGQFAGIDTIASGDDMLLMQKIKKEFPGKLGFIFHREAIVETMPMNNWTDFFQQRIRWASKAVHYQDRSIFWVLLLVYLLNFLLLLMMLASFIDTDHLYAFFELLLIKIFVELLFLYPVGSFFKQAPLLYLFPIMQPIHICYTVIAGWMGKFGSYQWKGRTVK
jgi:cellulose synthase/poly-beta-1,6-N-acetylglucosamine synthase-like glycosyltransferase